MIKIFCVVLLIFVGCTRVPSEDFVKNQFQVLLADDMKVLVDGIKSKDLLPKPHSTIVRWSRYEKGDFQYLAVVDFVFLADFNYKVVRKYRYHRKKRAWDRFYNEYEPLK